MNKTSNDLPPCPTAVCDEPNIRAAVNQICKEQHWPPNHQVLVAEPGGKFCYCTCGDPVAEAKTGTLDGGAEYCQGSDCSMNPVMVDLCQDLPPGRSALIRNSKGKLCICACWGGALAPYCVKDGEGEQVALDSLPVGGFVTAAGLDLEWKRMMVRYAARPLQANPQEGIRVTMDDDTEMLVPESHLFLTYQKKLIAAKQLVASIALMGSDGSPNTVKDLESVETHKAYQFLATVDEIPPKDLAYHLLDSQGVVSADHAVQKAHMDRHLPAPLLAYPYDWEGPGSDGAAPAG